jgi:glycosyltransferase involved in cell wall biosynthesis
MKVALVYDRVNKFGGAERVLLALHNIFPEAPLFTLVYDSKSAPWAKPFKVYPTYLNKCRFIRNKHEWLAPFAAMAFETLNFKDYEVVISITSSDAKAVITKPGQLHICYCLTPTRYFWSGEEQYRKDKKIKLIPNRLRQYFRTTDLLLSKRPDQYIAISNEVKRRIQEYYHRDSSTIYPPIDDKFYSKEFTTLDKRKYYLIVSRLVPYKKVDLAIQVFNTLKKPLIIVGSGSELINLKNSAGKTVRFVGSVDDTQLINLYKNAKAVIFPQEEDFGLVPLEAQACGTPVIAYGKGGALETVIKDKTGVFFEKQSAESLAKAIHRFEKLSLNPSDCHQNSLRFNSRSFKKSVLNYLSHSSA